MEQIQALIDAIAITSKAERETCMLPMPVYRIPMHATKYLEKQLEVLLRGEAC
jgi:hypothetical protein